MHSLYWRHPSIKGTLCFVRCPTTIQHSSTDQSSIGLHSTGIETKHRNLRVSWLFVPRTRKLKPKNTSIPRLIDAWLPTPTKPCLQQNDYIWLQLLTLRCLLTDHLIRSLSWRAETLKLSVLFSASCGLALSPSTCNVQLCTSLTCNAAGALLILILVEDRWFFYHVLYNLLVPPNILGLIQVVRSKYYSPRCLRVLPRQ